MTIKLTGSETESEIEISDFVKLWDMGSFTSGVKVKTENGFSDVTAASKTGKSKKMIRITDESGKVVECTPDHKIFTKNRGWVMAKHLKKDDVLNIE